MPRLAVTATPGPGIAKQTPSVIALIVDDVEFAHGTFGSVYKAKLEPNMEIVAVKKVLQERHYRNRELSIIRMLYHQNIVELKYYFYEETPDKELYLHLVMEYVPDCLYRVLRRLTHQRRYMPLLYVRLVLYQLLRALAFIHQLRICHRDIKPHNVLLNAETAVLKLCDFGSSKIITSGETNVSYICSRFYRSPECIFGQTEYDTSIDIWATGCIFGELLNGAVMFIGSNRADQIAQIIKILGTPTQEELIAMNPDYSELELPRVPQRPWEGYFNDHVPVDAIDLISKMLQYTPNFRPTAYEALAHDFFLPIKEPGKSLPEGGSLPPLFDWTSQELEAMPPSVREKLMSRSLRAENSASRVT